MKFFFFVIVVCLCLLVPTTEALTYRKCMQQAVRTSGANITVGQIKDYCAKKIRKPRQNVDSDANSIAQKKLADQKPPPVEKPYEARMALEAFSRENPYSITPFKPNYALFSFSVDPYQTPYDGLHGGNYKLQHEELEFQLSLRYMLWSNVLGNNGDISFAFTTLSFWQAFNRDLSSPFRETNYEPEIIFTLRNDWQIFGFTNVSNGLIFNHQSNGQSATLSRSWNRIMFNFMFERGSYVISLTPWYRLPENKKKEPGDAQGDDNPGITNYLGNFRLVNIYKHHNHTFMLGIQSNLKTVENRTTVDFTWSYPFRGRLLVYAKYFNGWGRSLIDYNVQQQTFSIGLALSDWL